MENLEKLGKVKFEVLSNVLGKTYDRSLLIFDEAQCSTIAQTKAFLSRMGHGSRAVLAGDYRDQSYIGYNNGMRDAVYRFRDNHKVGRVIFDVNDIVRDDFVKDVILAYRHEDSLSEDYYENNRIDPNLPLLHTAA